jgi:hypothetical protein
MILFHQRRFYSFVLQKKPIFWMLHVFKEKIIGIPHFWFCMSANFSPSYGWKVTRCNTRIAQPVNEDNVAKEEEVGDKGDVDIDTGESRVL